jgi:acetylornithine/N-succinyldiaminopimelate aminotransferase
LAKSLANGLPIGAVLIDEKAASGLQPGDHGTTFGGSPVPCAAALAHLRVRDEIDLNGNVRLRGAQLYAGLAELAARYPHTFERPRGIGLMLALPVRAPYEAATFVNTARESESLLINAAGGNTLRFVPPLIVSEAQIADGLARLGRIAERLAGAVAATAR